MAETKDYKKLCSDWRRSHGLQVTPISTNIGGRHPDRHASVSAPEFEWEINLVPVVGWRIVFSPERILSKREP